MLKELSDTVRQACEELCERSKPLAEACAAIDHTPHIRQRNGGYAGLFRIVIEQQVSVPSAQAILARCQLRIPHVSAATIHAMSEDDLRLCGLSRPKIRYVHGIAEQILTGQLDLADLAKMETLQAVKTLCTVKGIGPWTAAIYLLFCEGRLDIWPKGDVALLAAYAAANGFMAKPAMKDFDALADTEWAPWRGVAAHILWTYYAKIRGRKPI